nr:hypothetical protein [Mucilaginibacter corticis]
MADAVEHAKRGASDWKWAGNTNGEKPDVILACAGDVPTLETVAAAWLLQNHLPGLKVRVVNVIDLMALSPHDYHPHGMSAGLFAELFTESSDVIFAFHGYVRIIHDLIHGRPNPGRFHVRGYMEEGTTTTPFDMTVLNQMSRYHLAADAIRRLAEKPEGGDAFLQWCDNQLAAHTDYIHEHLDDQPEIKNWKWTKP